MKNLLQILELYLIAICLAGFSQSFAASPNFIIILTDDQGYNDLGSYGSLKILTPRIDKMAREGVRFTDFYVAHNVCSTSRAALLMGNYPARIGGFTVLSPNSGIGLDPNEVTLADLLKRKGYATEAIGKWHLGDAPKFLPTRQGFDRFLGIPYSHDMFYDKTYAVLDPAIAFHDGWSATKIANTPVDSFPRHKLPLMLNDKVIDFPVDLTTVTERYTNESIRFIAEQAKAAW